MLITLDWSVDRAGYHISEGAPQLIVPNSQVYCVRPIVAPALYKKLATCTANADGALEFTNKFGLLHRRERGQGQAVHTFCEAVRVIRRLIARAEQGNWEKFAEWVKGDLEAEALATVTIIGSIGYDEAGRPQLEFKPLTLFEFIRTQLLQDYTAGAQYRLCKRPGCGEYFYYGPGTGRRNTAEYCSSKCQGAHAYMKRKGESK